MRYSLIVGPRLRLFIHSTSVYRQPTTQKVVVGGGTQAQIRRTCRCWKRWDPPQKKNLGFARKNICDKFFEITVDKLLCPHFTINEGGLKDEFMVC